MKAPAFKEENEWRIVMSHFRGQFFSPRNGFRSRNGMPIPYLEVPLQLKGHPERQRDIQPIFSIDKIIYARSLDPKLAEKSLEMLTGRMYHPVIIERSGI